MHRISLVWAKANDIIPNPLNPRQDYSTKSEDMQRIIKEKGWEAGITCYLKDTKYVILSGHRRWYAAKQLGIQKIPVVVVKAPETEAEELERLGSVQGGKVDWSMYEWAKYTYEMWIIWNKCSFSELAKKMGADSKQIASRVKVFQYYPHSEIEEKLAHGKYSLSALYYLMGWLEKLAKYKSDLVSLFNKDLIRTTMLRKIEMGLVTVNDLKNEIIIRNSSDEQIKRFLVNVNLRFVDVMEDTNINKAVGSNRLRTHLTQINNALLQVYKIDISESTEATEILKNLENLKMELITKREQLGGL
ncbi:ParB/RepB/Spo0J family partition protein [Paenibacillus sp. 1_12]|uniref:ParB/RepB/Spo0J family partition protein n=1 Tax=Paenibacillus sp. 1_12 TaxID=1566278 RepID=UPI0008E0B658|nr:ParB/RepB/Spo0J family partition protein [Paenibacillus sp. 1_12]SFM52302.1 ParB/RepB/Spo0J family partition protein [Paenibacillus sp. 1_12]